MTGARSIATLVAKDLRIEAASRHTLGLALVLGLLIVTVLGLGFGPAAGPARGADATQAALWVAYLFCGVLCFERTMSVERRDDALDALRLAPLASAALFASKLITNLVLLVILAAVVTPVAVALFGMRIAGDPAVFAGVLLLSLLGFAAAGTLFSAGAGSHGLLALMVLPLTLPLVIASTRVSGALAAGADASVPLAVIVASDAVFIVAGWLGFEAILDP